jgi:hypothetical protein
MPPKRLLTALLVLSLSAGALAGSLVPGTYTPEDGGWKELMPNGQGAAGMLVVANGGDKGGGLWQWELGRVGNEVTNSSPAALWDSGYFGSDEYVTYLTTYTGPMWLHEEPTLWGGSGVMTGTVTMDVYATFIKKSGETEFKYGKGKALGTGTISCGGHDSDIVFDAILREAANGYPQVMDGVLGHYGTVEFGSLTIVPLPPAALAGLGLLGGLALLRRVRRRRG